MAILLSANAPARAQLDFATQTDTRSSAAPSGEWVETGDSPVVTLSDSYPAERPSPAPGHSIGFESSVAQQPAGSRGAQPFPALSQQQPHPAVVRIIAAEPGGASLGSGTLVDSNDDSGLIITNWHVVRDAPGCVIVLFPDGFQSMGHVLRMDSDWDLAAILIKKPQAAPVNVAREAPQLGERLTIAGYGSGKYRAANGACTQYLAPSTRHPFELVELAASARQGDSGGPIFNSRGELAGVLFGEGGGRTTGAYCGRVHNFLTLAVHQLHQAKNATLAANSASTPRAEHAGEGIASGAPRLNGTAPATLGATIAASSAAGARPDLPTAPEPISPFASTRPSEYVDIHAPPPLVGDSKDREARQVYVSSNAHGNWQVHDQPGPVTAAIASSSTASPSETSSSTPAQSQPAVSIAPASQQRTQAAYAPPPTVEPQGTSSTHRRDIDANTVTSAADSLHQQLLGGDSLIAQIKTVLAGIGLLACLFHGTRVLARTTTSGQSSRRKKPKYTS